MCELVSSFDLIFYFFFVDKSVCVAYGCVCVGRKHRLANLEIMTTMQAYNETVLQEADYKRPIDLSIGIVNFAIPRLTHIEALVLEVSYILHPQLFCESGIIVQAREHEILDSKLHLCECLVAIDVSKKCTVFCQPPTPVPPSQKRQRSTFLWLDLNMFLSPPMLWTQVWVPSGPKSVVISNATSVRLVHGSALR